MRTQTGQPEIALEKMLTEANLEAHSFRLDFAKEMLESIGRCKANRIKARTTPTHMVLEPECPDKEAGRKDTTLESKRGNGSSIERTCR